MLGDTMSINFKEDILPVSELKKNTRRVLEQVRKTQRPVILTVNGKASSVLIDVDSYEKQMKALNIAGLLLEAEKDITESKFRPVDSFLKEFKSDQNL
jgi:prevent-host-death family protein